MVRTSENDPHFAPIRHPPRAADPALPGKHRDAGLPPWASLTEPLPLVPAGRHSADPPNEVQTPAGPMHGRSIPGRPITGRPITGRLRIALIAVATVVLAGSAMAVYTAVHTDHGPAGAGPAASRLQAKVPVGPSPAVSAAAPPTTGDTETAAATTRPSSPGPSGSALSGFGPSPAPSPSPGPSASGPTATSVDLAAGRPITANGSSGSLVPANAVDGDPDTWWEGSANPGPSSHHPQEVTIDLGVPTSIRRIVLCLPPLWTTRTQTLSISGGTGLGSDGDVQYQTIVGTTGYTFDPASGNTVTIRFAATNVRYLRIQISATSVSVGQLSEIEIFAA